MIITIVTSLSLVLGFAAFVGRANKVEQAKYQVLKFAGTIQIRQYAPAIIAEVVVQGERKDAIKQGFRLLADYIFGNNTAQGKIAMTAPVQQQQNQKIAMTAPVMQAAKGKDWLVRFVMPEEYTFDTIPKPNNKQVKLQALAAKTFAVIQFSGRVHDQNLIKYEKILAAYLLQHEIKALSSPAYAFFNPPWTLPFMRRNEIMIEIQS